MLYPSVNFETLSIFQIIFHSIKYTCQTCLFGNAFLELRVYRKSLSTSHKVGVRFVYNPLSPDPIMWDHTGIVVVDVSYKICLFTCGE